MEIDIIGNAVVMDKLKFNQILVNVAKQAAKFGVNSYLEQQEKNRKLSVTEASEELGVSKSTVLRYITNGVSKGGLNVKLKAISKSKGYVITGYDLKEFKESMLV